MERRRLDIDVIPRRGGVRLRLSTHEGCLGVGRRERHREQSPLAPQLQLQQLQAHRRLGLGACAQRNARPPQQPLPAAPHRVDACNLREVLSPQRREARAQPRQMARVRAQVGLLLELGTAKPLEHAALQLGEGTPKCLAVRAQRRGRDLVRVRVRVKGDGEGKGGGCGECQG